MIRRALQAATFGACALVASAAAEAGEAHVLKVTVRNALPLARPSETVQLAAAALAPLGGDLSRIHVFELGSGKEVLAQALDLDQDGTPESLVFQADMPPSGERAFELRAGERRSYRKEDFRVYGRFVRERYDDFAWENDRIAHRMYGPALESWQREPLTSSAVDVWLKRTRRLIINDWYMVDDYHHDRGEGADFYPAGRSRGCGGSGLWRDGRLVVSRNFRESRVLANGPIRLVFELRYPLWDGSGVHSEVKRITLDAGQNFSRFESRYDVEGGGALDVAAGIKKPPAGSLRVERAEGWMRTWEPVKGGDGQFGCAIVLDPTAIAQVTEAEGNHLVVAHVPPGQSALYYVGVGWDQSGDFAGVAAWDRTVAEWAQRVRSPLVVEVVAP
jgi:unsaturated rhamnogalacturonyl hydrolase